MSKKLVFLFLLLVQVSVRAAAPEEMPLGLYVGAHPLVGEVRYLIFEDHISATQWMWIGEIDPYREEYCQITFSGRIVHAKVLMEENLAPFRAAGIFGRPVEIQALLDQFSAQADSSEFCWRMAKELGIRRIKEIEEMAAEGQEPSGTKFLLVIRGAGRILDLNSQFELRQL